MVFYDEKEVIESYEKLKAKNVYETMMDTRVVSVFEHGVVGEMDIGPEKRNVNGHIHGGALYGLSDSMAGVASQMWGTHHVGEKLSCTTLSSSMEYLRPGGRNVNKLTCRATVHKAGNSISIVDTSVFDEEGTELCTGRFTYFYIDPVRYQKK